MQNKYPDENNALNVDIRFGKEVTSIVWDQPSTKNAVIVKCKDNSVYEADHVIVTVPLGVLKNRYLQNKTFGLKGINLCYYYYLT